MSVLTERGDTAVNGLNAVLGIILLISPWLFGFAAAQAPAWTAWIGGLVIAAVSFAALLRMLEWEERISFVAGLCVMGAPWLFGFSGMPAATWTHVLIGLGITVLAVVELWRMRVSRAARLP